MVGVATALVTAAVLSAVLVRLGPALGYVDRPDDPALKAHSRPAVPLGGVAIFVGVHLGLLATVGFDLRLLVSTGLLLLLGLIDDRIGLSPVLRLFVSVTAGAVLASGAGSWNRGVVVVLAVVVVVNAVNLYDGLDGLAGLAAVVSAVAAAGVAGLLGSDGVPGLVVAAAIVGFLFFNWHPARAFLGDNGAYVVALLLVWLIDRSTSSVGQLAASLGVLGVFLVDLVVTVLRRWRAGAPLFAGDRSHLYDRLHQSGMSVPRVATVSAAAQVVLAAVTLGLVWLLPSQWAVVGTALWGAGVVLVLTFGNIGFLREGES